MHPTEGCGRIWHAPASCWHVYAKLAVNPKDSINAAISDHEVEQSIRRVTWFERTCGQSSGDPLTTDTGIRTFGIPLVETMSTPPFSADKCTRQVSTSTSCSRLLNTDCVMFQCTIDEKFWPALVSKESMGGLETASVCPSAPRRNFMGVVRK